MNENNYKIVRMFQDESPDITIKTGLSEEYAMIWCNDPETSSSTCTKPENLEYTKKHGEWFDAFTQ